MFYNNNGRWRHSKKVDSNDLLLRFIALLVVSSSLETFQFDLVAVSFQSMYPQKKTKQSYISRRQGSNLRPSSSKLVYDMKCTPTPKTTVPWLNHANSLTTTSRLINLWKNTRFPKNSIKTQWTNLVQTSLVWVRQIFCLLSLAVLIRAA